MTIEVIETKKAPSAIGPYSQGVKWSNLIFLSGQIGIDPVASKLVDGGIEAQTKQVFKNIKSVLNEAGADLSNVLKVTLFLKEMGNFVKVNEIYAQHFKKPFPARSAVAVKELPLSADIEIEVFAVI